MNKTKNNLGEGSILGLFLKLAVPAVISQVVNALYNIVDRMYIGHIPEIGISALTGLGLCFPIITLVTAFSSLFGMGGAPNAAIEMGKGDYEKAENILGNCFAALICIAVVITTILLTFGEPLLYIFGASDTTIVYAYSYLSIYAFGTIFVQLSLGLNMFITTQGYTKYSMMTVLIGAILNIILDPIFIFVFDMGVQGAALATIISQAVSSIWVLKFLTGKKTYLKIKRKNMRISPKILLPIMALGVSPFVMQSTESILQVCFNISLRKYGGDLAVGAMTISSSIMQLCFMPLQGLCQGGQPIISFNYGAGKVDRVKKAMKIQIIVSVSFAFIVWLAIHLVPEFFISIFNNDADLLEIATWALQLYTGCLFMMGLQNACQQSFVALGQAKVSLMLACLRKIILLIPLIFILPNFFEDKVFAVFLAEPVSDFLAASITFTVFMLSIKGILQNAPTPKDKV